MDIRGATAIGYQEVLDTNEGNKASTALLAEHTVSQETVNNQLDNIDKVDVSSLQEKKITAVKEVGLKDVIDASDRLAAHLKVLSLKYEEENPTQYQSHQTSCIQDIDKTIKEFSAYHKQVTANKTVLPNLFFYYMEVIRKVVLLDKLFIINLVKRISNTDVLSKSELDMIKQDIKEITENNGIVVSQDSNNNLNFITEDNTNLRSHIDILLSETPQEAYLQYKLAKGEKESLYRDLQLTIMLLFNDSIDVFKAEIEELAKNNILTTNEKENIFKQMLSDYILSIETDLYSFEKTILLLDFLKSSPIYVPVSCLSKLVVHITKSVLNAEDIDFFTDNVAAVVKKIPISSNTKKADIKELTSITLALPSIGFASLFKKTENSIIVKNNLSSLLMTAHNINKKIFEQKNLVRKNTSQKEVENAISQLHLLLKKVAPSNVFSSYFNIGDSKANNKLFNQLFKRLDKTKNLDYRLKTTNNQYGSGSAAIQELRDYFVHVVNTINRLYHAKKLDKETCKNYCLEIAEALSSCTDGIVETFKTINHYLHTVESGEETLSIGRIVESWLSVYILDRIERQTQNYQKLIARNRGIRNEVHDISCYKTALKQACELPTEQAYHAMDKYARIPSPAEFGTLPKQIAIELDARFCSDACMTYIAEQFKDETARDAYLAYFKKPPHLDILRANFSELPDTIGVHDLYPILFPDSLEATNQPWRPDMYFWIYFLKQNKILIPDLS